jgi:Cytochrome c
MLTRRGNLVVAGIALAVAVVAVVVIVALGSRGAQPSGRTPGALGEWIYRTGTDRNGTPIPFSGGMMMRASCVTCHGSDGRGRTTPMFTSPNITYANLTDPKGMLQPDGSRGPTYTDGTLKRAVTEGIDPQGAHLAWPMPQWQLTDREWLGLLSYLKTLR